MGRHALYSGWAGAFVRTSCACADCCCGFLQDSSAAKRNAPKVLVFANRIKTVRFVQQSLVEAGFKAVQLHGDRSQPEREVSSLSIRVCVHVYVRALHL